MPVRQWQLLILNRSRQRAPNLRSSDRLVAGLCALLIRPARLIRSAIVLKPSTLLSLHRILRNRKYRLLFSSKRRRKPGPKGPSRELIEAVVQTKRRNPTWGCPRIAQQIALAFNIPIDKDIVRRILASHYRPERGRSWLTFIGHLKDSLWSIDLFRSESATLRTHWVLVVMDQYTRRVIGFGVQAGVVDGIALSMFNQPFEGTVRCRSTSAPTTIRFIGLSNGKRICESYSSPYVPLSHPFVERLIGTIRREYLDRTLFWTTVDLDNKLREFRDYFNACRTHHALEGQTPDRRQPRRVANLTSYRWQSHCRGLYQTPIAA